MNSIITAAALWASTAAATAVGTAVVINKCEYDVYVCNVPASGGGYSQIDKTLGCNETYSQPWTELSNAQGWSIKLSKDSTLGNIMQYEYTFHNDGTIWYDLSDVNGNPWDGDWEITATNEADDCNPKDQAYRYSTDDAYGMQACSQDSTITVTLCSGESQNNGGAESASSSAASATSAQSTYYSPSSTPSVIGASSTQPPPYSGPASSAAPPHSTYGGQPWNGQPYNNDNNKVAVSPPATTLSTMTSSCTSSTVTTAPSSVVVTEIDTAVVTDIVTAYYVQGARRRDVHHQHHPHGHRA